MSQIVKLCKFFVIIAYFWKTHNGYSFTIHSSLMHHMGVVDNAIIRNGELIRSGETKEILGNRDLENVFMELNGK